MMTGDDIRNQRQQAQKFAIAAGTYDLPAQQVLVLWVIAEQLYEIRANLGILIDRNERTK